MEWFRKIYKFDYMGHKAWWFTLSGIIIMAGLVSLFVRGGGNPAHGLNYGIEFKSGTLIDVSFTKSSTTLAEVRAVVSGQGYADAQIQQVKRVGGVGSQAGFQIQTTTLSVTQQNALKTALNKAFTIATDNKGNQSFTLQTVGPTFGSEIVSSSWKAAIFALLLILVYVSLRFEWKFAVGAIAAEVHDLLVVVGIYSLTGRQVTTGTLAAVLTILGYSLYDTVIVFDRIRENAPRMPRVRYGDMVNRSIWETLTRSMNTTMITLLPVVALLLFGGTTLTDFAFPLLIGVVSGAYSSIFVASPILTLLKERDPQHRKLIARSTAQPD
jgi:SecD/SecF fusion protein